MLHSYRDTQGGGGGHIDPPQVVDCPNHPRLDRVKNIINLFVAPIGRRIRDVWNMQSY